MKEHAVRVKRVFVSPQVLTKIMTEGERGFCTKGIPKDAKFRGFQFDQTRNAITLFVEHESFPEVMPYEVPEEIEVEFASPMTFDDLIRFEKIKFYNQGEQVSFKEFMEMRNESNSKT